MFRFTSIRLAVLLLYFMTCAACGKPGTKIAQTSTEPTGSTSQATDINFIGGGTQPPEITPVEEPYNSPFISDDVNRNQLTWVADINSAIRMVQRDNHFRVMVWFRNQDCVDCLNIERDIFSDPEVAAVSDKWLFVKIDTAINTDRAEYYLHGADPPALRALDQQGHEYNRYNGVFTKEEFITMLRTW